MDEATKKLFAIVGRLEKKLEKLDELEKRLAALDTNGKFEEIKKQMTAVAVNSRLVVTQVEAHGDVLARMEKTSMRLSLRCPLLKPETSEFEKVDACGSDGETGEG